MRAQKSALQTRAEKVAASFQKSARRPIVIEFAGVPKAGKTSTISQLYSFLKRCGFKTEVVVERASVCPIKDKKHVNFNVWTACTTLAQILEKTQTPPRPDDPQILILDRGIFDSICWLRIMERLQRLRSDEREVIEKFLTVSDWRARITGVILMTVAPGDAMSREQGLLPVVDAQGSIMNTSVLQQMLDISRSTAADLREIFPIYEVDTSSAEIQSNPKKTAEIVADKILKLIEEHLEEDILHLPKTVVKSFFNGKAFCDATEANRLASRFNADGSFRSRMLVEEDALSVQALPVVVVRNASGQVLRLRRKESDPKNLLHEKVVIWAGGHVRKEDNINGAPITHAIVRELEEELRLRVSTEKLHPLGGIYIDEPGSASKHAAIVYEWRAETDDVEIALSNTEFFERRGNSLSGKFEDIEVLARESETDKLGEPWSNYIVTEFLAQNLANTQKKLL